MRPRAVIAIREPRARFCPTAAPPHLKSGTAAPAVFASDLVRRLEPGYNAGICCWALSEGTSMTQYYLLAALHHLAVFSLFGLVFAELALTQQGLTASLIRRIGKI